MFICRYIYDYWVFIAWRSLCLLFGVIAGFTNLIPYLGPYLGLAPAVLVTIFNEPVKAALYCFYTLWTISINGLF